MDIEIREMGVGEDEMEAGKRCKKVKYGGQREEGERGFGGM